MPNLSKSQARPRSWLSHYSRKPDTKLTATSREAGVMATMTKTQRNHSQSHGMAPTSRKAGLTAVLTMEAGLVAATLSEAGFTAVTVKKAGLMVTASKVDVETSFKDAGHSGRLQCVVCCALCTVCYALYVRCVLWALRRALCAGARISRNDGAR